MAAITRTILDGGINWNWYLCATFDDEARTVEIHCYDRWHKFDQPKHPKYERGRGLRGMRITEIEVDGRKRIASAVTLDGVEYQVINPANVFSYHDTSKMEFE